MITTEAARNLYEAMKLRAPEPREYGFLGASLATTLSTKGGEPLISVDWVVKGGKTQPKNRTSNLLTPDNSKWRPPEDEVLLASLHFACLVIHKYKQKDGIYIPELDDSIRAVDQLMVYWRKIGGVKDEPASMGYDIPAEAEQEIENLLKTDGRAAKEIIARLAMNIVSDAPLSRQMRVLVYQIMTGDLKSPTPPIREPTQRQRDTLLVTIADGVRVRTIYSGSANQSKFHRGDPAPVCGCTIAAAAMDAFGIHIDPRRASSIYSEKKRLPVAQINLERLFSVPSFGRGTFLTGKQEDVSEMVIKALNYFA
jgi:hypothetical protein